MILFEPVLLRLKEQLGVSTDKEVGELLGLSAAAFNNRKKRGIFPEDKLLALAARQPELGLDVAYILTGEHARVHAVMGAVRAATEIVARLGGTKAERQARADVLLASVVNASRASLSDEEQLLVGRYRASDQALRNEVMRLLLGGARPPAPMNQQSITGGVGQQFNAPISGDVAAGNIIKGIKKGK